MSTVLENQQMTELRNQPDAATECGTDVGAGAEENGD